MESKQTTSEGTWAMLLEDARWYPSPHNSQPIKVEPLSDTQANIYYDLDLGLPAENYGIPFGHVCAGVFLGSLSVVAAAKGFAVQETLNYDDMDFTSVKRLHKLGTLTISPTEVTPAAISCYEAFLRRQTSRRPYKNRVVDPSIIVQAEKIAAQNGYRFLVANDKQVVKTIVHVNQATLFDDLQNEPVYQEIMSWLRFSKQQAKEKQDGLSAETMLMPGRLLHFVMNHRNLWSAPIVGGAIRAIYLNTMRGVRQVGWLEGPFANPKDYIEAGRTFMKIWLYFTRYNVYLHPFGTVITNPRSHKAFVETVGAQESDQSMAWMLFRFGYSKQPPKAYRRSKEAMIVSEDITV